MTNRYDSVYTQGQGAGIKNVDIVKGIGFSTSNYTNTGNNHHNIADSDVNTNTDATDKFNNHENIRYKKNERLINFNAEF